MDSYERIIEGNPRVEWVHVSQDDSETAATAWARQNDFSWLTIFEKNTRRTSIMELKTKQSVPHYILADKNGRRLASGQSAVFAKLAELMKK